MILTTKISSDGVMNRSIDLRMARIITRFGTWRVVVANESRVVKRGGSVLSYPVASGVFRRPLVLA